MLALLLIAAHMMGDYILQFDSMAKAKLADRSIRLLHVLLYSVPFIPVAFLYGSPQAAWQFLIWNAAIHFLVDSRRWVPANHPWPLKCLLVDQTLHMTQLAVLGVIFFGLR